MGLGLAEVWGIIRGHDGFISFESVVGQGSSFEIHFPLARATPTAAPAGSGVILVLDHEDEIRQVIAEQLSARGKTVLLATNSAEGLALLAEHQNKIAVVIVNLDLPTDAGINLTQVLPRLAPAAKIILTYKQPAAESFESYKSRQVVAVISRENAPKDLAASIAKII